MFTYIVTFSTYQMTEEIWQVWSTVLRTTVDNHARFWWSWWWIILLWFGNLNLWLKSPATASFILIASTDGSFILIVSSDSSFILMVTTDSFISQISLSGRDWDARFFGVLFTSTLRFLTSAVLFSWCRYLPFSISGLIRWGWNWWFHSIFCSWNFPRAEIVLAFLCSSCRFLPFKIPVVRLVI